MKNGALLVLYDGHCLLCNRFIRDTIASDSQDRLRAAALQTYAQLNNNKIQINEDVDSVVLLLDENIYYKSEAVLRLKAELSGFSWFFSALRFVPTFIRDGFYDIVAKNRLKWFGRSDECVLPSPEERSKYLVSKSQLESYLNDGLDEIT